MQLRSSICNIVAADHGRAAAPVTLLADGLVVARAKACALFVVLGLSTTVCSAAAGATGAGREAHGSSFAGISQQAFAQALTARGFACSDSSGSASGRFSLCLRSTPAAEEHVVGWHDRSGGLTRLEAGAFAYGVDPTTIAKPLLVLVSGMPLAEPERSLIRGWVKAGVEGGGSLSVNGVQITLTSRGSTRHVSVVRAPAA